MDIALTPVSASLFVAALRLPRGGTFSWRGTRGSRVEVHAGRVWLTRTGTEADAFVAAGQTWPLDAAGTVVIECDSTEPAQVSIVQPQRSLMSRLWAGLGSGDDGLRGLNSQRLHDIGASPALLRRAAGAAELALAQRQRVLGQEAQ